MPEDIVRRPDPDPTTRTVDLVVERVNSLEKLLNSRLDGVTQAQREFQDSITRVPTQLQQVEEKLKELFDVKLEVVEGKFDAVRDVINTMKATTKDIGDLVAKALDAALKAATDTNDRVERATGKQIEQLQNAIDRGVTGLSSKVDVSVQGIEQRVADLKEIVNKAEGMGAGTKLVAAAIVGAVSVLVGAVAIWRL